ncbi:4'-phosphopantetheinyl transferase family protein [Aureimonas sp. D3]|uniref:4'-phosphopantetheinyl transferase family protein n=1 Tax=Aureimonas sp. D3 TaxID=1638164 RepID=UPI000AC3A59E|nr:4'-phosphopantetheinyl transferase superfamily protein [Aureimonas sp. D3]
MTLAPDDAPDEIALAAALDRLATPGIALACRRIRPGDGAHLLPAEVRSIPARGVERRRASGAARLAARTLLSARFGEGVEIPRGPSGQPLWPDGVIGSLAHDETMAVAAVACVGAVHALGIDVEPSLPLPDELLDLVVMPNDHTGDLEPSFAARLLFSAKEAVYKAAFPLDGRFLDYSDIAIDLPAGHATTRTGHRFQLRHLTFPRIVTLAFF